LNQIVKRAVIPVIFTLLILTAASAAQSAHFGFDRNEYPGDTSLKTLHQTFSYVGYWLNTPPGATHNSWSGKRKTLQAAGFGFLVVFNGRTYKEIKAEGDANLLGAKDAAAAISSARREGFPAETIIFIDQEEGGRMLPEQRAYLHAWIDFVAAAGFRTGVYCSGIAFKEGSGKSVITAEDIKHNAEGRKLSYWVSNDACPPSPGCTVAKQSLTPAASGLSFVEVWQFAQSPRRKELTKHCAATYNKDRNCYPPEDSKLHVDLDVATSPDPSHGRTKN
jgi:hypothetical protein